jgi:hypothetical protein
MKSEKKISASNRLGKLKVITPQISGKLFGNITSTEEPWGEHGSGSWMQAGPPWIQSGSFEDYLGRDPDDTIFDIGGLLSKELLLQLSKDSVTIIKGSNDEQRWRLAVPKGSVDTVKQLLIKEKISYIKGLSKK